MSTVTVLGASGYIGGRLLAHLRRAGHQRIWSPGTEEILGGSVFSRPLGKVFYCIGKTADFAIAPLSTLDAHAGLLARLVLQADYERLVYLSSTRLYDGLAGIVTEETPLQLNPADPRHLYDITKALGEHFVLARSSGRGRVARLSSVYDLDPAAGGFLSDILQKLLRAEALGIKAHPAGARDYVHIKDVLDALVALMDREAALPLLNVASGENVSNAQLVAWLADAGRRLSLEAHEALPVPVSPVIDVMRLRQLGVQPGGLQSFIAAHFARLDVEK